MAAVASITIVVDEKGAVKALDNITGAAQKMPGAFNKAGSVGNVVMTKLTEDHRKANESVRLLSESLGIGVPRALQNVITSSTAARAALSAVFTGGAVIAFASLAIETIKSIERTIDEFSEEHSLGARLFKIDSVNRERFHTALKQEEALALQAALATASDREKVQLRLAADVKEIDKDIESAHVTGGTRAEEELIKQRLARRRVAKAEIIEIDRKTDDATRQIENQAELASLTGIDAINKRREQSIAEQEILAARDASVAADLTRRKTALNQQADAEILKAQKDAAAQGTIAILQAEAAAFAGRTQIDKEYEASQKQITNEELTSGIFLSDKLKALAIDRYNKITELDRQRLDELREMETQTAIAILPPWQRAYAEIVADADKRIHDIQALMTKDKTFQEQGAREVALIQMQEFAKVRDQLAGDMESLFDDVTSGNIGRRFKKMFEDMVFQMVATWVLGMRSMRGAAAGAMGGGTGGILGALFGFGGSGGGSAPGGTPLFVGDGSSGTGGSTGFFGGLANLFRGGGGGSSSGAAGLPVFSNNDLGRGDIFGLGLSAGQGSTPSVVLPAGSGPKAGGMLGALGLNGLFGLATLGGGALLGSKNTILKSIGGLLLGGGIGAGISSAIVGTSLGALLGPVGAFLGPIGALAGFAIPLIMGLFGEHKGDKARKQIMEPLIAQIKLVRDSFDVFQTDYNTGVSELEKLRSDSIAGLKSIGGRQVKGNTTSTNKLVDDAEAYMKGIQAERARRSQLGFGPPQFHQGGVVWRGMSALSPGVAGVRQFHSGGVVNANLLEEEGVVNRAGMRKLGAGGLAKINAGGSLGGEVHFHINAIDAKSFDEFLSAGGADTVMVNILRGQREGRW